MSQRSPPPRPAVSVAAPRRDVATRQGEISRGDPGARFSPTPPRSVAALRGKPEIHSHMQTSPCRNPSLPRKGTARHLSSHRVLWGVQCFFGGMAPCRKLVFQVRGRSLPERLSHLKTKAKFGPSPSGRARQSVCPRERRPPAGTAASRLAPEGRGRPKGPSCSSGQRDGSGGRPGHRTPGTSSAGCC